MNNETWGFIGLGNIGYPMAMNLRQKMPASCRLIIQDVNSNAMTQFIEEAQKKLKSNDAGSNMMIVDTANDAREVAERSTVLITCLPSPQIVKNLFKSILEGGKLPQLEQERLFIDCSTIDPPSSREVAKAVQMTNNGFFVDAPVSGGVVGARAGTLTFMFGAPKMSQLIERIRSVLLLMGNKTWHMGEQGAGVCSKLANNYLLSITNIATAEALNMGRQSGLDLKALSDLISSSTGRCWSIEANNPVPGVDKNAPASNGYQPGGSVNIVKKDLGLAMAAAEASGAVLPLANKAYEVYEAVAEANGNKDFSVVYQWLQNRPSN